MKDDESHAKQNLTGMDRDCQDKEILDFGLEIRDLKF
jgi:hypothetical protein